MVTLAIAGEIVNEAAKVTVAEADPPGPDAVTVADPEAGVVAGAVYKPDEVIEPAVVDHVVAPTDVNCSVCPSVAVAELGDMVCGAIRATVADADPPRPVAVTVTDPEEGMVDGAVYRPAELIVPAVAVHDEAPAAMNCWVLPRSTDADAGEITWGARSVTVVVAVPFVPFAVMVTNGEEGMVDGAV